jgi:predicted DNA-binding WGR domain protein
MKKYFEYKDAVSNKFWEINLKGKIITLTYGKIGAKGQKTLKDDFVNAAGAKKFAESKIRKKTNKGYVEK